MAPKQRNAAAAQQAAAAARAVTATPPPPAAPIPGTTTSTTTSSSTTTPPAAPTGKQSAASRPPAANGAGAQTWDKIFGNVLQHYLDTTPQRTKLLDAFMAFLVAVGALQFLYCILAGNYVRDTPPFFLWSCRFTSGGGVGMDGWMDGWNELLTLRVLGGIAVQCVLVGLLGDGGAVCSYG